MQQTRCPSIQLYCAHRNGPDLCRTRRRFRPPCPCSTSILLNWWRWTSRCGTWPASSPPSSELLCIPSYSQCICCAIQPVGLMAGGAIRQKLCPNGQCIHPYAANIYASSLPPRYCAAPFMFILQLMVPANPPIRWGCGCGNNHRVMSLQWLLRVDTERCAAQAR